MNIFRAIDISTTGLTAEKSRIDIISKNIANANTTRTAGGEAYRRQQPVFKEINNGNSKFHGLLMSKYGQRSEIDGGVKIVKIEDDQSDFILRYEPGHPDANDDGYVAYPNVNIVTEMVNMIDAQRAYDANITTINASKSMMMKALDIGRR